MDSEGNDGSSPHCSIQTRRLFLRAGIAVLCAAVLFLVVDLDLRDRAKTQYLAGEALLKKGTWWKAATRYLRALRHHAPGNPWSVKADERLFTIAEEREKTGDAVKAAEIYEEMLGAYRALKSSVQPFRASRSRAEAAYRRLSAKQN